VERGSSLIGTAESCVGGVESMTFRESSMTGFIRVEGGPHLGLAPVEQPLPPRIALGVNESLERDDGPQPYAFAVYELQHQDGEAVYVFQKYVLGSLDDRPQAASATEALREDRLNEAIKSFYENPDYDIYTTRPTDRHEQVLVQVGHRRAQVDAGIASVIRELFRMGLDTIGSCQEQAKGEPFEGQAYVGFCRERDARRFYNILNSAGIEATFKPKKVKILSRRSPGGPLEDQLEVPSGNVMFSSCVIERVAEILRSESPSG
jgi:hypothetical protein